MNPNAINLAETTYVQGTMIEIEGADRILRVVCSYKITLLMAIGQVYGAITGQGPFLDKKAFADRITILEFNEEKKIVKVRVAPKTKEEEAQ